MKPEELLTTSVMNGQTGSVNTNVKTPLAEGCHVIDGVPYFVITVQRRMEESFRERFRPDSGWH